MLAFLPLLTAAGIVGRVHPGQGQQERRGILGQAADDLGQPRLLALFLVVLGLP